MKKHRDAMRALGLRPELWSPDTRGPGFAEECRRQADAIAAADENDRELQTFLDAALEELGRTEDFG